MIKNFETFQIEHLLKSSKLIVFWDSLVGPQKRKISNTLDQGLTFQAHCTVLTFNKEFAFFSNAWYGWRGVEPFFRTGWAL